MSANQRKMTLRCVTVISRGPPGKLTLPFKLTKNAEAKLAERQKKVRLVRLHTSATSPWPQMVGGGVVPEPHGNP